MKKNALKRLHLRVYGKVQGVFFRAETRAQARYLLLRGWVRNLADGSVELMAEGNEEKLLELLAWCQHGPSGADVERVESNWEKAGKDLNAFEVRY